MTASELRQRVLDEMDRYLKSYEMPAPGATLGIPWSRETVASEVEQMRHLLVDPIDSEYVCGDSQGLRTNTGPPVKTKAWVVAKDGGYGLMFDPMKGDFVLV